MSELLWIVSLTVVAESALGWSLLILVAHRRERMALGKQIAELTAVNVETTLQLNAARADIVQRVNNTRRSVAMLIGQLEDLKQRTAAARRS